MHIPAQPWGADEPAKSMYDRSSERISQKLCDSMAAFTLTVRGKENYDLLCAMRDQLELASDLLREKNQASL